MALKQHLSLVLEFGTLSDIKEYNLFEFSWPKIKNLAPEN